MIDKINSTSNLKNLNFKFNQTKRRNKKIKKTKGGIEKSK